MMENSESFLGLLAPATIYQGNEVWHVNKATKTPAQVLIPALVLIRVLEKSQPL